MEDGAGDGIDERTEAFFEQIGAALDVFVEEAAKGVRDPDDAEQLHRAAFATLSAALTTPDQRAAFELAVRDALTGLTHSIMYALDGGSEDAPQLLHADGTRFPIGLNEWIVDYFLRTGRMP